MSKVAHTPQLRFPEFSGDWEEKKLSDISDVRDGTHESPKYVLDGFPLITSKNLLSNGSIDFENINLVSEEDYTNINKRSKVDINDILFGMIGTIGNPVIVKETGFAIKNVALIKQQKELLNKFMIFYLSGNSIAKQFYIENTGGTQKFLALGVIRSLKIKFPPDTEQQKIAAFLTAVDNKIEQLSKKQALLGEYKKGLMQQIFSQATRFKADDDSEFPDWEERVLGDYLAHKSKKNKNNEVDLVLSVSNKKGFITQDEQFDGYQVASKDLTNYKIVEKGEYAYNPSRINVGSIARLKNNTIGIVSPMYVVFKLKNLDSIFFDNLYQTHLFKHLIKVGCSGSVRDSLNFNDMADFVFSFPSLEEQAKIVNFLSSIDSKIEQVGKQLDESKQFKKALLQQMFV